MATTLSVRGNRTSFEGFLANDFFDGYKSRHEIRRGDESGVVELVKYEKRSGVFQEAYVIELTGSDLRLTNTGMKGTVTKAKMMFASAPERAFLVIKDAELDAAKIQSLYRGGLREDYNKIRDLADIFKAAPNALFGSNQDEDLGVSSDYTYRKYILKGGDDYLTFSGSSRPDVYMDGGSGVDTFGFNGGGAVRISLRDDVAGGGGGLPSGLIIANFEKVSVTYADATIIGSSQADYVYTNRGSDVLVGKGGRDTLISGWDRDTLYGGNGNDMLMPGGDRDTVDGGKGNDTVSYHRYLGLADRGALIDLVAGKVSGSLVGSDRLYNIENVEGTDLRDKIYGDAANNKLWGHDARDLILGGAGADRLFGGLADDTLNGGAGKDVMFGGAENDTMNGNDGADRLLGEQGDDDLIGGAGSDRLNGGAGLDTLDGETGDDRLTGGADADVFILRPNEGRDVIVDFDLSLDSIDLRGGFDGMRDDALASLVRAHDDGIILRFGGGQTLELEDVALEQFDQIAFI